MTDEFKKTEPAIPNGYVRVTVVLPDKMSFYTYTTIINNWCDENQITARMIKRMVNHSWGEIVLDVLETDSSAFILRWCK